MLKNAQENGYAVAAFNIENMEMAQAVIEAAEECAAPVILQTTPSTLRYASPALYKAIIETLAKEAKTPIAIHLDHGDSIEMANEALHAGYTSIMIDGSHGSLEENITLTSAVVAAAKLNSIPVEAELGKVGGKEDDLEGGEGAYTDPDTAKEFVKKTGIDSLAVAIGTAHGVYASTPKLDIVRLKDIRRLVDIPLVLHGASGLLDEQVIDCIREGICKVNFATELRAAYSDGIKSVINRSPDVYDPKKYGTVGREHVKQLCINKIMLCGCHRRAI